MSMHEGRWFHQPHALGMNELYKKHLHDIARYRLNIGDHDEMKCNRVGAQTFFYPRSGIHFMK